MRLIDFVRSTLSALRRSSPTAWIIAMASGPGLYYAWSLWLEREAELETGAAMFAVSVTFAARIATHRRPPPATQPTHRALATAAAALVPVLASAAGAAVLSASLFLDLLDPVDAAEQVACLSYSYGCALELDPHLIPSAVVTVAVLALLAPLPLSVLEHGAKRAALAASLATHIRGHRWLALLALLVIANILFNLPVWGLVAVFGTEQLFIVYFDTGTHSVLALVYACAAIAAAQGPPGAGAADEDRSDAIPATAHALVFALTHWRSIGAALAVAAFLWLPLPLTRHSYVNLPCHWLADRTAVYASLNTPLLFQIFAEQELLRVIRNVERNRNGAECALNLFEWVFFDRIPEKALREAERRR